MPTALDDAKLGTRAVAEEVHLILGVDDGVDRVFGAVHPQDRQRKLSSRPCRPSRSRRLMELIRTRCRHRGRLLRRTKSFLSTGSPVNRRDEVGTLALRL